MNKMLMLQRYFPAGRAETERKFLRNVFVMDESFYDIVTPQENSIRILVGKKGSGKSALLEYLKQTSKEQEIPTIILKPDDVFTSDLSDTSMAAIKRTLYNSLIKAIAVKIGKDLEGLVSGEKDFLVEAAEKNGDLPSSLESKILGFLSPIGKAITNIDFEKMLPSYVHSTAAYSRAISEVLSRGSKYFYLLFDDTDQISMPTSPVFLETIWGLILAIQKIAEDFDNIKPIITIRWEVWLRLIQDNSGARDQVDHFRSMVRILDPDNKQMEHVYNLRIREAKFALNSKEDVTELFFKTRNCKLPYTEERRRWPDYFVTSSRNRPRDLIQLVYQLSQSAINKNRDRIEDADIDLTTYKYSKERVSDLVNENEFYCPQILTILQSFKKVEFENSFEVIKKHLMNLPGSCHIEYKQSIIRSEDENDAYVLWKLLYDIEFLTPRIADASMERGFRHIRPLEDPELVSQSRISDMNKYSWDIHPSYGSFLIFEKEKEKNYQIGKKK